MVRHYTDRCPPSYCMCQPEPASATQSDVKKCWKLSSTDALWWHLQLNVAYIQQTDNFTSRLYTITRSVRPGELTRTILGIYDQRRTFWRPATRPSCLGSSWRGPAAPGGSGLTSQVERNYPLLTPRSSPSQSEVITVTSRAPPSSHKWNGEYRESPLIWNLLILSPPRLWLQTSTCILSDTLHVSLIGSLSMDLSSKCIIAGKVTSEEQL